MDRLKDHFRPDKLRIADEIAQLDKEHSLAKPRPLINSRFEMAVGETILAGTSKIGGDKRLIVLLTAVAAEGK